jgi:adhesin transport system outer membrane protein
VNSRKTIRTLCLTASTLAFVALGAGNALAQQDTPLHQSLSIGLKEAVATGISTNPEYGVVAASRRATDEELNQGKALYLPSVDVRADTGYEYSDDPGTRAGAGDDTEGLWRYEASATLTQMLFDGWESKYEVARQTSARYVFGEPRTRDIGAGRSFDR